jgi:hypothetical protein
MGRVALGCFAGMLSGGAIAGMLLWVEPKPRGDTPSFGLITLLFFMFIGAIVGALGGLLYGYASLPAGDSPSANK